ncbi:MAG: hypothetical protein ACRDHI_03680 [Actinomycetota bacterium]
MEPQDRDADRDREGEETGSADHRAQQGLAGDRVAEEGGDEACEDAERDPLDLLPFGPARPAEPNEQ